MRVTNVFCVHPLPAGPGAYRQGFDAAVLEGDRLIVHVEAWNDTPAYDLCIPAAWCTYQRPSSKRAEKAAPKK